MSDVPVPAGWTLEEMRAANAARTKWRLGRGPELTDEQRDAMRAYTRWRSECQRRARGVQARPPAAPGTPRKNRPYAETLDEVLDLAGEHPEQVCRRLGMTPSAIDMALRRVGRPDLARPFNRLHQRLRYANRRAAA